MPLEPDCADQKAALLATFNTLVAAVDQHLSTLNTTIALLKARRTMFCDTGGPNYNPTCCSLYGNKVAGLPADLSDRRDQLVQFANDAILAIDCNGPDWQAQVTEANARLDDLRAFDTELQTLNIELNNWIESKQGQCPITLPGEG